jgi:hypothetical protein
MPESWVRHSFVFYPHNIDIKFLHLRNEATKFDILDSCKLKQNMFLIAKRVIRKPASNNKTIQHDTRYE